MISVARHGAVHVIALDRPLRMNALDDTAQPAIVAALRAPEARAFVLTGTGRVFCTGQDLRDRDPRTLDGPVDLQASVAERYNPLILALRDSPVPVICALNGMAAGAGVGLALGCDIVLAAREAQLFLAFTRIGLGPDSGVSWFLTRALGEMRAKALMLTAGRLTAEEAAAFGLVHSVHEAEALMPAALDLAQRLAAGPALALANCRAAAHAASDNTVADQLRLEAELQGRAGDSPDYAEGVLAFLEKRSPRFGDQ